MAQRQPLIVLINGVESWNDIQSGNNELEVVNRIPAILERFPDSKVIEFDALLGQEARLGLPMEDWILQSAVQGLEILEDASQMILLAFNDTNTLVLTHRVVAMFFAGYPDINDSTQRRHYESSIMQVLLDYKSRISPQTFTEMLDVLPNSLYAVDSDFAAIAARYCPIYLPCLPLTFETPLPTLEEAFLEIDRIMGSEHTQLLSTYESFLSRGAEIASELRRPALPRTTIDSAAWVLGHPTFQQWREPDSSPLLFISGPPGSGKRILSLSIPYLLDAQKKHRGADHRELYLVFDFGRCNTRLETEKNFLMSLVYQCLALRPQLFRSVRAFCQLILDLKSGSISSSQLWSLLRQLLVASDDHRIFLILVAIDKVQGERIRRLDIFNALLCSAAHYKMSGKLRILLTGHTIIKTEPHELLCIDLFASEESRAAVQRALAHRVLDTSKRSVWRDYLDGITKNPFFPDSTYFDAMLRVALLESNRVQMTRASLTQALESMKSVNSIDGLYHILFESLENFSMAKEALNWVFHATRPLTISELSVAIALSSIYKRGETLDIEPAVGEDTMKSLEDNISWDLRRDLRGIIGKFIQLVGSTSSVELIHHSFRQFFMSHKDLCIPDFHSLITQRCLAYISGVTKHEDGSSISVGNPSRSIAFLRYADQSWTEHYKLSAHPNPPLDGTVTTFLLGNEGLAWFERLHTNANAVLGAVDGNPLAMVAERGLMKVVKNMKIALHPPFLKGRNPEAALQAAIWRDDLIIFEEILPTVLPFLELTFLWRCLKLASEYGRIRHASIILSNLDPSLIDTLVKSEDSPCLIAAKSGHMETLMALLDQLPEYAVLQTDSLSRTVLHWAAAWGDADALRKLFKWEGLNSQILSVDMETSTALHLAAASGSGEAVGFLLKSSNELVEMRNCNDLTALHLAAKEGHVDVVDVLIKENADVWARSEEAGCALSLAAEAGHLPVFSLLFDETKKNLKEISGRRGEQTESGDESHKSHVNGPAELKQRLMSSLNLATRAGHSDVVAYILCQVFEYVQDIEIGFFVQNYLKSTCNNTIKVFFNERLCLTPDKGSGLVSLAGAVLARRADLVKYMVNAFSKRSLKVPTVLPLRYGGNIMHLAAKSGTGAVMRELLRHPQAGSLLQEPNALRYKPLDIAVINGKEGNAREILCVVKERRPQSNLIFRAIETKQASIVQLLLDNNWGASDQDENRNTPLHVAIETGQDDIVKLLLQRGASSLLNECNNQGDTPLHIAVSKQNKHIVRWLLDVGADPNALNSETGLSPLHLLCESGEENVDEILREFISAEDSVRKPDGEIRKKTDFSLPTLDGSTALHYAIRRRDPGLIRTLLEQSPNLNTKVIETGVTPIMGAITDIEVIKLLLNAQGNLDLSQRNRENQSALDMAIDWEEWPTVKELIEAGAEVDSEDIRDNPTPLYTVASKGNLQMVELLLSKGANPNTSGQSWLPPFQVALYEGRDDIAKAILESGNFDIKIDSAPYSLGSHLHAAIWAAADEIIGILISKRANTKRSASPFGKPIHLAMFIEHPFDKVRSFVEDLVEAGAQVNDQDLSGRTAISLSLTECPSSDITYLLNLNANPNIPDQLGATPLHYAAQTCSKDNLERLIEKGGDVTSKDKCNRSVLYRAAGSGDCDTFVTVLKSLPEDCRKEHLASAIYPAIARRAADIVDIILEGTTVRMDARDRNGWTVLDVTEAYGDEELISRLRREVGDLAETDHKEKIAPSAWNPNDIGPSIRLFENDMEGSLEETIEPLCGSRPTNLRANACMFPDPETGIFYFEVTILQAEFVSIGFCEEYMMLDKPIGLFEGSWGYHSDDGCVYWGDRSKKKTYGPNYGLKYRMRGEEAVLGCGIDFRNKVAFFTLDGKNHGERIF
ncbi:ankyrin repeat-containing domain protein [Nemania abortiva]|nr:ankyrin repeat-containing domain protein [Nemania abortiva]